MALILYNSLTRQLEPLTPLRPPAVSLYTCGPTVYDAPHIGNLRTFVTGDLLRRVLEHSGYEVKQVVNITDVDDKTIAGAHSAGRSLVDFTREFENIFLADLESLNLLPPTALPRATEFVNQMIAMIEKLLAQGSAYASEDGIYFKIKSFPNYGVFQKPDTDEDFALWKFQKPEDGDTAWEASFGRGRPGWHIECSAMIEATLGQSIDIHLGGTDLAFPHHENERAQSESLHHALLAKIWLHSAFVNINAEKMSKSLGNVVTLKDIVVKGIPPLAYRYWLLSAHYRTLTNFTWEALAGAQNAYQKLRNQIADLAELVQHSVSHKPIQEYLNKFTETINNDLNLPVALSLVWQLLNDAGVSPADKLSTILEFDKVLGLDLVSATTPIEIPAVVAQLLVDRESARLAQDFPRADTLRQQIEAHGYTIEDTPSGPKLRKM